MNAVALSEVIKSVLEIMSNTNKELFSINRKSDTYCRQYKHKGIFAILISKQLLKKFLVVKKSGAVEIN